MTWTGPEGQDASRPVHVIPIRDLREHVAEPLCPCMPRKVMPDPVVVDGEICQPDDRFAIYVHHSYDGREIGEVVRKALDLLGVALANHQHVWTMNERIYFDRAQDLMNMHYPEQPA